MIYQSDKKTVCNGQKEYVSAFTITELQHTSDEYFTKLISLNEKVESDMKFLNGYEKRKIIKTYTKNKLAINCAISLMQKISEDAIA
jgi:hypothetical protein